MNTIQAIIFGIVEGITEFLPISSTAHLDFTRELLGIFPTEFVKSFEIAIQLGAILAVVWLYRQKLLTSTKAWKNIIIAFIPTGLIGFGLYSIIKNILLGNTSLAAYMLIIGGAIILLFEKRYEKVQGADKEIEKMNTKELLVMGTTQALAVVPGVSRSLSVILSGQVMGLSRRAVAEFSFLLAIPTMLSATVFDLYKSGIHFSSSDWSALGVGFVVSFIVAMLAVKWLITYLQNHSFKIFGWYRILIGVVILLFLI